MTKTTVLEFNTEEIKNIRNIVIFATDTQLALIKQNVPQLTDDKKIDSFGGNIYELELDSIEIETATILLNPSVGELIDDDYIKETMFDFEGSKEFYREAKKKKGFKIISDEYSDDRNAKLYSGFSEIESNWREVVSKDKNAIKLLDVETLKPSLRQKGYDHNLALYNLSEFFETFFFSVPSDEYLEDYWNKDLKKDSQTAIEMTKLTRMSELGVSFSKDELDSLRKRRNACMHFRTVTPDEYNGTVETMNKYLEGVHFRSVCDGIKTVFDQITKSTLKDFSEILESYFNEKIIG